MEYPAITDARADEIERVLSELFPPEQIFIDKEAGLVRVTDIGSHGSRRILEFPSGMLSKVYDYFYYNKIQIPEGARWVK